MQRQQVIPLIRTCATTLLAAFMLTYLSLLVPGEESTVCTNLITPATCKVPAYGYPLPFLVDDPAISPVGSVARDPLSIYIGLDELREFELSISALFWLDIAIVGRLLWKYVRSRLKETATSTTRS
jgi:hypothetical protein